MIALLSISLALQFWRATMNRAAFNRISRVGSELISVPSGESLAGLVLWKFRRLAFFTLTSSVPVLHSPNPLLLSCQTGSLFFDN
jgi:hypothetical protein